MPSGHRDSGLSSSPGFLTVFELQRQFVEPLLRTGRFTNTLLDFIFYDVWTLAAALLARGAVVVTEASSNIPVAGHPLEILDLSALTNPSGSIIIVDPKLRPHVRLFRSMENFIEHANGPDGQGLHTLSVTVSEVLLLVQWRSHGTYPRQSASRLRRSCQAMVLQTSFHKHSEDGLDSRCTTGCNRQRSPSSHS